MTTEQIATALGFTLEDLALNKAGRLGAGQWWMLIKPAGAYLLMVLGLLGGVAGIVLNVKAGLWRGLALFVSAAGGIAFAWLLVESVSTLVRHRVASSQGVLSFTNAYRGVDVTVGDYSGTLSSAARAALTSGGAYRIYYLSPSNRFLSIETLPSDHLDEAPPPGGRDERHR